MDTPPVWGKRQDRPLRPLLTALKSKQLQSSASPPIPPIPPPSTTAPTASSLKIPLADASLNTAPARVRAKTAEPGHSLPAPTAVPLKRAVTPASVQRPASQHTQPDDAWRTDAWQDTTPAASLATPQSPPKRTYSAVPMTPTSHKRTKKRECPETIVIQEMRTLREENTRLQTTLSMQVAMQEAGRLELAGVRAQLLESTKDKASLQEQVVVLQNKAGAGQEVVKHLKERLAQLSASLDPSLLQALHAQLTQQKEETIQLRENVVTLRSELTQASTCLHATQHQAELQQRTLREALQTVRQQADELNQLQTIRDEHVHHLQAEQAAAALLSDKYAQLQQKLMDREEEHSRVLAQKNASIFEADSVMTALAALQEGQAMQAQQHANEKDFARQIQMHTDALARANEQLKQQEQLAAEQLAQQAKAFQEQSAQLNKEVSALQEQVQQLQQEQQLRLTQEKEIWQHARDVEVMRLENHIKQTDLTIDKLEKSLQHKEAVIQSKEHDLMALENLAKQHETRLAKLTKELEARDKQAKKPRDVVPETQEISSDHSMRKVVFSFDEAEAKPRRVGYKKRK
ncbi:hypothetical protein BCR37DRAFT_175884 [Protomyces lactucae-debilis]|uniref:Uncharacterized protein n=1 Tax=Protomyces lactucae-debilis TaxID=2754530 RepID=A0A1Y2EW25_PROLT|nr:uncharacterized protein BCR37DRAFT_175884 [Protomyces lactucae-debilis]ORY75464.1 hypothetical protein BCR37DRAFT_175884 [Protomyces lactucae-debilis]